MGLGTYGHQLVAFASDIVAIVLVAQHLVAQALGHLLDEERCLALRTRFIERFVPDSEITVGIITTAVEHPTASRLALDDVAAVQWTRYP